MSEALRLLGWNPVDNPRNWDQIERHNAAGDVFVTCYWREMYRMRPNSKFILNTRNFDDWVISLRRIPGFWKSQMLYDRHLRHAVYGTDYMRDTKQLRRAWDAHHSAVMQTIPERQLLVFKQPFKWEPLCQFLQQKLPTCPFPHLNNRNADDVVVRVPDYLRRK